MSKILLENVTKSFGSTKALDNLNLEISSGEFFSLIGPSGCGKTTTMRLIAGLEEPDEGRILVGDKVMYDSRKGISVPPTKRELGMVFQDYALWPHMTVEENVLFGLIARKIPAEQRKKRMDDVLRRLLIDNLVKRYPSELSGGQQQRVALARELVTGTRVLLMDEPLSNLDAKLRIDMRVELKELHRETGVTVVYVTHDQIESLTLSTKMAVMQEGLVKQYGVPQNVFVEPNDLFVLSFMGNSPANIYEAEIDGSELKFEGIKTQLYHTYQTEKTTVILAVRPEDVRLVKKLDDHVMQGSITSVLPMGYHALVQVKLKTPGSEDGARMYLNADLRQYKLDKGDSVFVQFEEKGVHIFDSDTKERVQIR